MKMSRSIIPLLALLSGCAVRPAYFGNDSRLRSENGSTYWEASAKTPAYLQARMRRRQASGNPTPEKTEYIGSLEVLPVFGPLWT